MSHFDEPRYSSSIRFHKSYFKSFAVCFLVQIVALCASVHSGQLWVFWVNLLFCSFVTWGLVSSALNHDRLVREQNSSPQDDSVGGA